MDNFDKTLVSGVAILVSFLAGYQYAQKNLKKSQKKSKDDTGPTSTQKRAYADNGDMKMVLVVRNDLKMGKGKIGAQCGHAAVGAYQKMLRRSPRTLQRWEESGSAKIAVKVDSEEQIMQVLRAAKAAELNTCLIHDAGRTQIAPNSKTVLAVGPASSAAIDQITGHLKLL